MTKMIKVILSLSIFCFAISSQSFAQIEDEWDGRLMYNVNKDINTTKTVKIASLPINTNAKVPVRTKLISQSATITVTDVHGNVVLQKRLNSASEKYQLLKALTPGRYYIHVRDQKGYRTEMFMN